MIEYRVARSNDTHQGETGPMSEDAAIAHAYMAQLTQPAWTYRIQQRFAPEGGEPHAWKPYDPSLKGHR